MRRFLSDARNVGIFAAAAAVGLGLVYMTLAGAPARLLLINASALAMGVVLLVLVKLLAARPAAAMLRGPLLVASSLVLLATALGGMAPEGASRWLSIGGLAVQPGLILAPMLVTGFAARSDRWSVAAVALAVVAIGLQPDRGVAAMILAGVAVVALSKLDPKHLGVAAVAAAGFVATLLQADTLGAMPYVDQLLYSSFAAGPAARLAVWTGVVLMVVPVLITRRTGSGASVEAFAALWTAGIVAAAAGNYPTPLVGYGASAIIGYLLGLAPLARPTSATSRGDAAAASPLQEKRDGSRLRFA